MKKHTVHVEMYVSCLKIGEKEDSHRCYHCVSVADMFSGRGF